jgi:hypothetical protein
MIGTYRQVSDASNTAIKKVISDKEAYVRYCAFKRIQAPPNVAFEEQQYEYNLDDVIIEGKAKFAVLWTPWDEEKPEIWYESEIIENPTNLDAAVYANDMIHKTGDTHHIFLEQIIQCGVVNGMTIFTYAMGS